MYAIRRDVAMRVAELVEKLLLYGIQRHAAAGRWVLGYDEAAIRFRLHDRVSDVGHVWNRLPVDLAVAAGTLRAALDDVAGDCAGRELVVFFRGPAEAMDHRRQRERGVGGPAGDHYVVAGGHRLGERESADVGDCA